MTADGRVISYINSLGIENNAFLEELYKSAVSRNIPVVRRESQSFIKTLLQMLAPERILEIGTAVGFSALLMAFYSDEKCVLTTLEKEPRLAEEAVFNISRAGMEKRIRVIQGDANETLKTLEGAYDLVFMDAAKAQYESYLSEVKRLMRKGSVLLADNIFQEGSLTESRFLIERRDRTIHKRMREFLYDIKHDPVLETSLIPLGDGMALCVMRN